jgi:POT family proton-dependent oligopeptide transporter
MGVWFMANAMANDLAGQLGKLYPGNGPTKFLMFTINDLHDFFMIFVVMAGIAAVILFFLSKQLLKMMGGLR